jgi:DNA mismatch repair protein MutL
MQASSIQILPEDLINKIAAGEVIERPASVVKELLENSIDAGATKISIEIQNAGRKLMRVSDNGIGMSEAEIALALQRHSTSKIKSLEDLSNLSTLGFRGEALPSIASVSRMKIECNPSGQGLTVEIKDLFYNTPVRLKFLKSNSSELGHIGDIIAKYAMAYPSVAFSFISDGKPILQSSGNGNLKEAIMAVYGFDLVKQLVECAFTFDHGRIHGLISLPTLSRIDKGYENFYVNQRYIRNFLLNRALEEGYRTLIPSNRYPVAVLFIEIEPNEVDVNVHPTKREVKFAKTQAVMDAVRNAVLNSFKNLDLVKSTISAINTYGQEEQLPQTLDMGLDTLESFSSLPAHALQFEVSSIEPLFPIYQHRNTYIVATDGEDLVLIDQHAAHERILYDRLTNQPAANQSQPLLIPENIEVNQNEKALLAENLTYLSSLGFEIEEFGNNSYLLRSVPAVVSKTSAKQLFVDLLAELSALGRSTQVEIRQENLRKLIACHSAIKAGDSLDQSEMKQLIRDLYLTKNPLTCPHGRPTMLRLSEEELLKRFQR